ncbi:MAG: hypothetical protein JSW00_16670 [Thermoplasmata archaeon]|nr:MAG: hypothetical protein JSW00_16670 [Thermoplasmata archaeon]
MIEDIDLREVEKKAWRTYMSQDGLYDIFMGIMLLTLAIQAYFYNIWFTSFIFVAVLVVTLGKRFITLPRIGLVKFGKTRMMKQMKMMIALLIVFLVVLTLYYLSIFGNKPHEIVGRLVIPAFIASIFVIVAYFLNYIRLGIYGLLYAFSEILRGVYDKPIRNIAILVIGMIALIVGLYVLIQFLKKYPLPGKEENLA